MGGATHFSRRGAVSRSIKYYRCLYYGWGDVFLLDEISV